VVFILIGARVFSLTFYGVDGHKWVEELLVSLPGGQVGFLQNQLTLFELKQDKRPASQTTVAGRYQQPTLFKVD
jgi:hypothetical protein